jgi:hypothetical protein
MAVDTAARPFPTPTGGQAGMSRNGNGAGGYGGGGGSFLSSAVTKLSIEPGSYRGDGGVFVVPVPIPVPELSTWAMMFAGFTSLSAMALRRKRKFTPA